MTKKAKGRQGDLFEEARGGVLRNEFKDTRRGSVVQTAGQFIKSLSRRLARFAKHGPASTHRRETLLEECRKSGTEMWNSGDYASALGLCISCLNIESEYLPGKDAAYVKTETDKIIEQAAKYFEQKPDT